MIEGPGTILGGLPVIATVDHGKDADTPNGPGEYWAEVRAIYWRKRDGSKGAEIPEHIIIRAEKYDSYFSCLIEQVEEYFHYEKWKAAEAAKAIEAGTATTPQSGVVHESASPTGFAQSPSGDPLP
jgi:hypothetical protein